MHPHVSPLRCENVYVDALMRREKFRERGAPRLRASESPDASDLPHPEHDWTARLDVEFHIRASLERNLIGTIRLIRLGGVGRNSRSLRNRGVSNLRWTRN